MNSPYSWPGVERKSEQHFYTRSKPPLSIPLGLFSSKICTWGKQPSTKTPSGISPQICTQRTPSTLPPLLCSPYSHIPPLVFLIKLILRGENPSTPINFPLEYIPEVENQPFSPRDFPLRFIPGVDNPPSLCQFSPQIYTHRK